MFVQNVVRPWADPAGTYAYCTFESSSCCRPSQACEAPEYATPRVRCSSRTPPECRTLGNDSTKLPHVHPSIACDILGSRGLFSRKRRMQRMYMYVFTRLEVFQRQLSKLHPIRTCPGIVCHPPSEHDPSSIRHQCFRRIFEALFLRKRRNARFFTMFTPKLFDNLRRW